MNIKNGSKWHGANGRIFVVINTTTIDGKDWVYYRAEKPVDHLPAEFSCYQESFIDRFNPLPDD